MGLTITDTDEIPQETSVAPTAKKKNLNFHHIVLKKIQKISVITQEISVLFDAG